MNRLQAEEKIYANLKSLWKKEREINAALVAALKAILDIDNPPAGEYGHVDFNDAIVMGRLALALVEGDKA